MMFVKKKLVWETDLIDKILVFSTIKRSFSEKIRLNFQLASFSIQGSIKIYSERIFSLSISSENFFYRLQNRKFRHMEKNFPTKNFFKSKNLHEHTILEKIKFYYNYKFFNFKIENFKKFKIFTAIFPFSKYNLEKHLKSCLMSFKFIFKFTLLLRKTRNWFFLNIDCKNISKKTELEQLLLQVLNQKRKFLNVVTYNRFPNLLISGFYRRFLKISRFLKIKRVLLTFRSWNNCFLLLGLSGSIKPIHEFFKKKDKVFDINKVRKDNLVINKTHNFFLKITPTFFYFRHY